MAENEVVNAASIAVPTPDVNAVPLTSDLRPLASAVLPVRLDIGAGKYSIEGFTPIDIHDGNPGCPLSYADASVDEIRASHVLEHFSYRITDKVLKEWFRVLKPGGVLRVAVPDLDKMFTKDTPLNLGYLLGGHQDEHDVHMAVFNRKLLEELMLKAGFVNISTWESEINDCATLPISLNLKALKPSAVSESGEPPQIVTYAKPFRVRAVMSVPRLGFMANFFCAFKALSGRQIPIRRCAGAFWNQALETGIVKSLAEGCDAILTLDYDTVFTGEDVDALIALMRDNPDVDALVPLQACRWRNASMFTVVDQFGIKQNAVRADDMAKPMLPINTGHFGLTLLRASTLAKMPHPWFHATPAADGMWGDDREDADIRFWRILKQIGGKACLANRVAVGHVEEMALWPGQDLKNILQPVNDFFENGKPQGAWK